MTEIIQDFAAPTSGTGLRQEAAPKWKMAIVSWLAIFPTLTLCLQITAPLLGHASLVGRVFVNTLIIAPMMTWVIMPTMIRLFRPWLFPSSPSTD